MHCPDAPPDAVESLGELDEDVVEAAVDSDSVDDEAELEVVVSSAPPWPLLPVLSCERVVSLAAVEEELELEAEVVVDLGLADGSVEALGELGTRWVVSLV